MLSLRCDVIQSFNKDLVHAPSARLQYQEVCIAKYDQLSKVV